ncbi:MAG: NAD-dependent epimerase/dehydratase family protein [Rhodoglobus sp.]
MSERTAASTLDRTPLPDHFEDAAHLEEFMSLPTQATIDELATLDGDIIILGVAGKMGVTLARLIKRAAPHKRVIGVARFSNEGSQAHLNSFDVETIVCDLLNPDAVATLPQAANVIYMAGLKFDFRGREGFLWAMNTYVPSLVAQHYRDSRIVALSTIHVYPWSDSRRGGVTEESLPLARPGEYANSVVGRERMFQYFSEINETPGRLVRFVYAIDMRYGVFQEIADWVVNEVPIPLDTGNVNVMWQGDAINHFARLLTRCETPATPINIGGPETVSVRYLAEAFGREFGIEPIFVGTESESSLTVNCDRAAQELGNPIIPVNVMVRWVAHWVRNGGETYGKPSKFQVRTGVF